MLDCVIWGGMICDGSGRPPYPADVGIRGDRIECVGTLRDVKARKTVDAAGLYVLPGMIDVHCHSDVWLLKHPDRMDAVSQGITTEIVGPCGIGVFPLTGENRQYPRQVRAIIGDEVHAFSSCDEYLNSLPATALNVAAHVSHSPLRAEAAGFGDQPLTEESRKKLIDLTSRAFEEGACALSTGLAYFPAAFGDTDEVALLGKVASRFDAPVTVHQRTALRAPDPAFDPREEVLEFARRSGARLHYSHYRTTPKTAGETDALLAPIRRGRAEGLRITADFYPYPVGAGYTAVILPMWAMDGGMERAMEALSSPRLRDRLLKDVVRNNPRLSDGVVVHAPRHPGYLGRTYEDIARERGQDIPHMLLDLLREEELNVGYQISHDFSPEALEQQEKDFITLLREPYYMLGSDSLPGQALTHPRSYGAFAKMLRLAGKYGLDWGLVAQRVSAAPAELFGLKNRGKLEKGYYADLFLLDAEKIRDNAAFEDPFHFAEGIRSVFVNGRSVYENGQMTGCRPGRPLRRGQD